MFAMLSDGSQTGKAAEPSPSPADQIGQVEVFAEKLGQLESQFTSLREQIRVLQKYATVGTMAAVVAHEMNNMLTPFLSYSQWALTRDDPQLWRKALDKAVQRAQQMSRLCNNILGQTTGDADMKLASVQVRPLVEDTLEAIGRDWQKDKIDVRVEIEEGLLVRADSGRFQQVLLNLFINARHAMDERGGRLTISANASGETAIIRVSDTGVGIPEEHQNRVFEPFFSTKSDNNASSKAGSGLGLHISRNLIREMNGDISVESAVGNGATFQVTLPLGSAD